MSRLACEGGRPVRETFLTFGRPLIGQDEIDEVVATLRSGWIGFGPKCLRFEDRFAAYAHAGHAISTNSATAALHLALLGAGVGPGDEVVTTPLTFVATANVILHVGARPVFVDVEPRSMNIAPSGIEAAITPRTRALLIVHMAGQPCDLDPILDIARRHGLPVIEDAAHAIEAWYRGRKIGSIGRFTAFSFYATKNLTTAEGGMLTTDDEAADRLRRLRLHGLDHDAWKRYAPGAFIPYEAVEPGFKYNMTDLQASLGLHQLARIEERLEVRQRLWDRYDDALADLDILERPWVGPGVRHARHLYTVRLRLDRLRLTRQEFTRALAAENIGTGIHFVPVHLHQHYREHLGLARGAFPVAEAIGDSTLSLPLTAAMTPSDVDDVVAAIRKLAARYRTDHDDGRSADARAAEVGAALLGGAP